MAASRTPAGTGPPACAAPRRAPAICSSCRPALLYATFVLAPVVVTAILAFAYYDPMMGSYWVGWDNFHRFFTDRRSLQILWNTLRFALFAVTFNVAVGLLLALALNRAMPGWLLYFFRLAFFLPVIIAAAFVSIVWSYFYADDLGVINYYLRLIGLPAVRWLTDADQAMTSIIIMDVWKNTGFFMVIFIAALQGVPKNILEAAVMDGTPAWRQFFRITLPWISPVVFFCIVYASIGALQVFEIDHHPDQRRPRRRHALAVDPDRRGRLRQLPDRLRRLDRGGDARADPRHHRRPAAPLPPLGAALSVDPDPAIEALDRPRDPRGDGAPRRRHAAAVPLALLDVVPPGRPTPTSCRRASSRRASISPTTAPSSPPACRSCRSTGTR